MAMPRRLLFFTFFSDGAGRKGFVGVVTGFLYWDAQVSKRLVSGL